MSLAPWEPAYVGLGSNLGDPVGQLRSALVALNAIRETRLEVRSGLYRNPPMGPPEQPDYVNAVAGLLTRLPPEALLAELQAVESAHGRSREGLRWGPRTLDLDLLVYGGQQRDEPSLCLPHPGIRERAFVLFPLAEFAPDLVVPGVGSVARLCRALPGGVSLQRIAGA